MDKYLSVSEDIDMGKRVLTHAFGVVIIAVGLFGLYGGGKSNCTPNLRPCHMATAASRLAIECFFIFFRCSQTTNCYS